MAKMPVAQVKVDKLYSPPTAQLLLAGTLESFNGKRLAELQDQEVKVYLFPLQLTENMSPR